MTSPEPRHGTAVLPAAPRGGTATPPESRGARLAAEGRLPDERVALVDLLDRLLAGGVVVTGDLVLSISGIDLVRISLRVLIMSVRAADPADGGIRYDPSLEHDPSLERTTDMDRRAAARTGRAG